MNIGEFMSNQQEGMEYIWRAGDHKPQLRSSCTAAL